MCVLEDDLFDLVNAFSDLFILSSLPKSDISESIMAPSVADPFHTISEHWPHV